VPVPGGKLIDEHVGRSSTGSPAVSVAHMRSPADVPTAGRGVDDRSPVAPDTAERRPVRRQRAPRDGARA
jgi:hypothetical protein